MNGTSTMHDYMLTTTALTITGRVGEGRSLLQAGALQSFEVQIPVNSFTTEKDGLKKKMLETMKADKYPVITFRLDGYDISNAPAGHVVAATGTLAVAGVEQPVQLSLDIAPTPDGIRVTGTHPISMKSFGIKAPTMFMGMLKTDDKVTITFELQLSLAAKASN
jgi:polyisoprenoid-binding protein YceI